MEFNFTNKVVLVTGATRGIGHQLASDFEKLGAKLILTGTRTEEVEKLNKSADAKRIRYYCVDFLEADSFDVFLGELKKYDRIDVCINNAGINRIDYLWESRAEDWDDIMNVNLRAPFLLCREVAKLMKKNGWGRIINISSILGVISREKRTMYSSSKSGLIGLTRAIAIDLGPYNILVNCVSPGFVLTDLTKKILTESEIRDLKSIIPLRRLATPEEISKVVLFLASDLNTYISGQNIIVDGGYVST